MNFRLLLLLPLLLLPANPLLADHPYDPKRYAFEIFSEDEIALSKYAAKLDENEIAALLERSWADLDTAAAKTAGLSPEESRKMIQDAVRGENGVSANFEMELQELAGVGPARQGHLKDRLKQAASHPIVWAIGALFVLALFLLNRRRA